MAKKYPEFGRLLDKHLREQERSGSWLARKIGVDYSTVSKWRGDPAQRPGEPEVVDEIAKAFALNAAQRKELFQAAEYEYYLYGPSNSEKNVDSQEDEIPESSQEKSSALPGQIEEDGDIPLEEPNPQSHDIANISYNKPLALTAFPADQENAVVSLPPASYQGWQSVFGWVLDQKRITWAGGLSIILLIVVMAWLFNHSVIQKSLQPENIKLPSPTKVVTSDSVNVGNIIVHLPIMVEPLGPTPFVNPSVTLNETTILLATVDLTRLQHPDVLPVIPRTQATVTNKVTPVSTAEPYISASGQLSETLIIIATFFVSDNNKNTLIHREIRDKIREEAQKLNETLLSVEIDSTVLRSDQLAEAEALGKRYNASMVIWGDDTGARVTVNFLNLRQPDFRTSKVTIDETERTQISNPRAYNQFVVDVLPSQLTFLALYAVGQNYFSNHNYLRALENVRAAVAVLNNQSKPSGLDEAYFRLGWLYQSLSRSIPNFIEQSIANYDKAIELNPNYTNAYHNLGIAYYHQGRLDEAIAEFDKAIQINPNFEDAYSSRGLVRADQGKLEEAFSDYGKAIELNPNHASTYSNRGIALGASGKFEEAIADFNIAIQLEPGSAGFHNNRGVAYKNQGEFEQAMADYNKAIQINPNLAEVYINRGIAYHSQDNIDDALIDFDEAIKLNPNRAEAYGWRGAIFLLQERVDEAIADFSKWIAFDPDSVLAYNNRALAFAVQGKLDEAIADYDKIIELNPTDASAYVGRGAILGSQGKLSEAVTDFSKAIALNPKSVLAYNNRARVLINQGKLDEAIADFDKIITLNPTDASAYNDRAAILGSQGKLGEAIADYERAIALSPPKLATIYYNRGITYYYQGQKEKAAADFREYLKQKPDAYNRLDVEQWISSMETCNFLMKFLQLCSLPN